jgi:hypothetical protein
VSAAFIQGIFETLSGLGLLVAGATGTGASVPLLGAGGLGVLTGAPSLAVATAGTGIMVHGAILTHTAGQNMKARLQALFSKSEGSAGGGGGGKPGGKEIPWSSPEVKRAAEAISNSTQKDINVNVSSRSQAEEIFLRMFHGEGHRNTTGWNIKEVKQVLGGKGATYH